MKFDKEIWTRAGVIWSIIGVVMSTIFVIGAFSIDGIDLMGRIIAIIMLVCALVLLLQNLKAKKFINTDNKLDDINRIKRPRRGN
ncbi:MAG: hypothetical protein PUE18_00465 [Firmicutes bacterium]|nr:hypothetical protein [Bacillota bacterium]